jgi:two-component system, OmpR family, alkaline phosphatase synthesis response regulator PhoP
MNPTDGVARPASQTTHRVLVVEDEESLALGVRDALQHAGFEVHVALDGPTALQRVEETRPELIVLDLMLPGMSGLEVLEHVRAENRDLRVVILTALANENDLVRGFSLGADDYIKKPFAPRELVARVEAQFRRKDLEHAPPARMDLPGGVQVDLARLEVHRDGEVTPLTPREGDILAYLVKNRDRVVTREDLLLDVWHYRSANVETRTVDIHIVGLRRKVEPDPARPTLIQTVRGKGYRWFS